MKYQRSLTSRYTIHISTFFLIVFANLFFINNTYSQVDYYYGRNRSGVRLGVGVGAATLNTHFNQNPYELAFIGSLDYDFNPFLSFGFEAQQGTLKGVDDINHLRYNTVTNKYLSATANVRVAVGEFFNFEVHDDLKDIIERVYLGVGVGAIHANDTYTDHPEGTKSGIYGDLHPYGNYLLIPINVGTNIDLPGVLGMDRISINPNFQLNYVNSLYLDGFQSTETSTLKGFYNIVSVKLKYKF